MPSAEGRRCAQEPRLELLAVGAVVDPFAGGRDPLAGGNGGGMANHGHDVTMPARLSAHDAKTVLSVVVGYSLDEACQHLAIGWFGLDFHEPRCSIGRVELATAVHGGNSVDSAGLNNNPAVNLFRGGARPISRPLLCNDCIIDLICRRRAFG